MVKSRYIGDGHPTCNRNPYNGYINPYYWVDDHPLLYGNNGSLDPGTYNVITSFGSYYSDQRRPINHALKTATQHPTKILALLLQIQVPASKSPTSAGLPRLAVRFATILGNSHLDMRGHDLCFQLCHHETPHGRCKPRGNHSACRTASSKRRVLDVISILGHVALRVS